MIRDTQNRKFGKLLTATKGEVNKASDGQGEVKGKDASGATTDTVKLGVQADSEKLGWFRKRHKVVIEDADGNPSLKFRLPEINGKGYVIVSDQDEQGHQAEVRMPVGPLNQVAKYFDPESSWNLLPRYEAIEKVEIEREGRDIEIKIQGEGRETIFNFSRTNFSVANL